MTGKIFLKLILGVFCLLLLALVTVDYFATQVAQDTYIRNLTQQLADKARMLALSLPDAGRLNDEYVRAMARAAGGRITVVRADGKVLVDSEANAAEMENHRTRPELMQAFRGETGSSIRHSATIGVSFLYVAVPAAPLGGAIRIAVPLVGNQPAGQPDSREDSGQHGALVSSGDCHCGGAGAADFAAAGRHHGARRRAGARQLPRAAGDRRFERIRTARQHFERHRRKPSADRGAA